MRAAVVVIVAGCLSCVSTRSISGGPDPRAALPPLVDAPAPHEAAPLRSVLQLSSTDPIIDVRVVFESGSADDPAGKEGLTALTVRLMREATLDKDAAALADALFPLAAEISVQVDKDVVVFAGRCHKDHQDAFVRLVADVLTHPRLDPTDFARLRDDASAYLTSTLRANNDEALQREALEAVLYDDRESEGARHPYHHTPTGTVVGLAAITLDDVRAQMARVLTQDRLVLGVAGGAEAAVVEALSSALRMLPATGATRVLPSTPELKASKLLVVDKPSAGTAISLGFPVSLARAHPDYPAMKLAETWFGEHRNLIGHLFHSMREVRGLNYGDYAYVEHFVQEGSSTLERTNVPRRSQYFSMWIRPVEHKNRLFALRMGAWELARFVDQGIPDDQSFDAVKSFVRGYWRSKEQDPMRRLGYAVDDVLTGSSFDREGLRQRVQQLTRAEVNAAIHRQLAANKVIYVVVTQDATPLVRDVLDNKPSPIAYAAKVDASLLKEDEQIVSFDLGLAKDDVTVVPPSALFQQ